jgi:flagellar biosynthesis protein FlhB
MADEFGEKTEAPTAKRKREAVEQGNILRSREFGTALVMLAGVGWLVFMGPALMSACRGVMTASFDFGRADIEAFDPWRPLAEAGSALAIPIGSLFLVAVVAAVASQAGLGSLRFNAGLLAPKASRINPASGLARIFGMNGWIELGKSLLKVILLGAIGAWVMWKIAHMTIGLAATDLEGAIGSLGGSFRLVLFAMAAGLVGIAAIDVPVQLVRLLGKLRMSKQEIRDEHKETEGSPEAKAHIRNRQRESVRRNKRAAVASAHVVLTNPTHFAVALRYDRETDQVPVVVAKGRGVTALAVRDLAGEYRVPVLEYPALARAVYYTTREGQEVRDDLYVALATILAFVFGLAPKGAPQPAVLVPPTARFDENGVLQT